MTRPSSTARSSSTPADRHQQPRPQDLRTTLAITERLAPRVPKDRIVIAESGIFTHADLDAARRRRRQRLPRRREPDAQADVAAATRALLTGVAGKQREAAQ